tara:strand:+ start:17660 stop:18163 length:504 start_codon:yes stop_codon:yes gene_type:complete
MNNQIFIQTVRFVALVLAQVFVFNKIDLFGFISPYIYVLFILLYPVVTNQIQFIFISFLLGLSLDFFGDSGGIHAAACLTAAYVRPFLLKFAFGVSYEYNTVKVSNTQFGSRLLYFTLLIVIHHLVLFSLEIFNLENILYILKFALFSSVFTILISMVIMVIFSRKK